MSASSSSASEHTPTCTPRVPTVQFVPNRNALRGVLAIYTDHNRELNVNAILKLGLCCLTVTSLIACQSHGSPEAPKFAVTQAQQDALNRIMSSVFAVSTKLPRRSLDEAQVAEVLGTHDANIQALLTLQQWESYQKHQKLYWSGRIYRDVMRTT